MLTVFKFKHFFLFLAIVPFFLFTLGIFTNNVQAATGINRQINFQGKLVNNPAATNVNDTSYTVVFTLYDDPDAGQGTALWTETQTVTTVDGIFRVALGSVTPIPANFNFNWDGLYLGIKVNSDAEMTPRVQMAAVPFAFNAERVAGLTVQDTAGNASTSGTLQVANGVTVKLPVSGTGLIYADSASTGTLATLSNSTTQTGNVVGQAITLSGATGSLNQTGLQFNLSGATSGTALDMQGTSNSWYVTRTGALTVASCSGCGTGGGGYSPFQELLGAIVPNNSTMDFLVGGQSTDSAKFAILNVNSGIPIASIAGNLVLGSVTGTTRTIGATAMNALQLGDANTGAVQINPNGSTGLYVGGNGNVGIGTTNPGTNLQISGTTASEWILGGTASNNYANMIFGESTANGDYAEFIRYSGATSGTSKAGNFVIANIQKNIIFSTAFSGDYRADLYISSNGKIGIGVASPLSTLDVRANSVDGGTISVASVSGKTSYAGLVVDNSGVGDIFTASASGETRFVISQSGAVTIGTLTNGLTLDPVNGGPTYTGTGRPTKTITLSPEYAGGTLTASGSATTNGSMTADASPSANFKTYYEWSSTQASLQDYTIAVRVTLPSDFSGWSNGNSITIDFNTATTNAPQNKFDLLIFNPSDTLPTTPVVMRTDNVSSVEKTWQTLTIASSALTGGTAKWQTAGQTAVIYLKLYAGSPGYIQVGDIALNYLSKF